MFLPEHGGALHAAAKYFAIPLERWLDLSTGINPSTWPVPAIPNSVWRRLPDSATELRRCANHYYGSQSCVAVPGSQAAIQILPKILQPYLNKQHRSDIKVLLVDNMYREHEKIWSRFGAGIVTCPWQEVEKHLSKVDVLILVNPNNPTGQIYSPAKMLQWHEQISRRGGFLIVDEAFMDVLPQYSIAAHSHQAGLIVLRSIGKFFGLAGLRLGFVLAQARLCQSIAEELGPWSVSHCAEYVGIQAIMDTYWQEKMRKNIHASWTRLGIMLKQMGLPPNTGEGGRLFHWVQHEQAGKIVHQMAQQGILLRLFQAPTIGFRIGLPEKEQDWQRLELSLQQLGIKSCAV